MKMTDIEPKVNFEKLLAKENLVETAAVLHNMQRLSKSDATRRLMDQL